MSSIFTGLRISHRVLMLAIVAVLGIACIASTLLIQREIEAGYRAEADALTGREARVLRLTADLQASHLYEKDFLLEKDLKATELFKGKIADAKAAIDELSKSAAPTLQDDLKTFSSAVDTYATAFSSVVRKNEELGLNPTTGLEGSMRSAVHSIESLLESVVNADVRASMLMLRRHEKDFILRRDPVYIERHAKEAETFKTYVRQEFKPGADRQRIMDALEVYRVSFRLYSEASIAEGQARSEAKRSYEVLEPIIARTLEVYAAEKSAGAAENLVVAAQTMRAVTGTIIATVLVLFLAVYLIGRSITRPVMSMTGAMRRLAQGDVTSDTPGIERRDEFGSMAQALEVFRQAAISKAALEQDAAHLRERAEAERIRVQEQAEANARAQLAAATTGLAEALRLLASGDLSFEMTEPFAPDFEALRHDVNQAVGKLNGTMAEIAGSSHSIHNSSREVSNSNDDLARRTEQQAASLEEAAAALDEITTNVRLSSQRAEEARKVATDANADATRTEALVSDTIHAMSRIEQSSAKIANILVVIDEIAFQTNLLALNAGVEAARAGEAGRGFAVVAQEVRELAQRSARSAGEIKVLIRTSADEVAEGARFVRETGAALARISSSVETINMHVEAIATASREQSIGLGEINSSVNHLDQGTQQNAAMVEENNAASAVLSSEAARLNQLLSMFRLGADRNMAGAGDVSFRHKAAA